MIVVRTEEDGRKDFKQMKPEGEGFTWGGPPKPWPLYNRTGSATRTR
jgi:hypothetical protein